MKITKISIENYKGITEWECDLQNINFFIGPNGQGKSSVLEAFRFCLTGKASPKDVRGGADSASVSLSLEDGGVLKRTLKGSGKRISQTCYINGKKTQAKTFNEVIEDVMECNPSTLEALIGTNLLESVSANPKELNTLLMSIMPLDLSREKLLSFLEDFKGDALTQGESDKINESLKADSFTVDLLDQLYKTFYKQRTEKNALLRDKTGAAQFDMEKIAELPPKQILEGQKEEALKKKGALELAAKQQAEYYRLLQQQQMAKDRLQKLQEELNAYSSVQKPDESALNQIQTDKRRFEEVIETQGYGRATLASNMATLQKVLNDIQNPVCPLSSKIICTTDKRPYEAEIRQQMEKDETAIQKIDALVAKCREQVAKREQMIEEYQKSMLLWTKKEGMERQITEFVIPQVPEKPPTWDKTEEDHIHAQLNDINQKIQIWAEYEVAKKNLQEAKELEKQVAVLDFCCNAFGPKGVKVLILQHALEALENQANEAADILSEGFRISFVKEEDGIALYARTAPGKDPVPVSQLSKGERTLTVFLLMEIIQAVTGTNVLMLDDLDRLDGENLRKLLSFLSEQELFDTVLLGAVDHRDALEAAAMDPGVHTIRFAS